MGGTTGSSAYTDLIAALVAIRSDPATARFDAELARVEAAGALDGATARTLRWWQRESVRGLADHLLDVLPGLLASLEASDAAARAAVEDSAASWTAASVASVGPQQPPPTLDAPLHGPDGPVVPTGPALRDVSAPPRGPHSAAGQPPPASRGPEARQTTTGAPRHRLLVGGLTVLGDGGGSDTPGGMPMS